MCPLIDLIHKRCRIPTTCYTVYARLWNKIHKSSLSECNLCMTRPTLYLMPTTTIEKFYVVYMLALIRCVFQAIISAHLCRKIKEKVNLRPINFGPATLYSDLCVDYGNFVATLWLMGQIWNHNCSTFPQRPKHTKSFTLWSTSEWAGHGHTVDLLHICA